MVTDSDEPPPSKVFVSDHGGPDAYTCFFEDDGVTGYFYLSDARRRAIVKHLQIYDDSASLGVREEDVSIEWSRDHSKCAVMIWGSIRGIFDVVQGRELAVLIDGRYTPPITDADWLQGF